MSPYRNAQFIVLAFGVLGSMSVAAQKILHPAKQYCAVYEVSGMEKGTYTVCQRNHSDRYEKYATQIGFGPFKQSNNKHSIFLDEYIFTYEEGKDAFRTKNPIYPQLAEGMKDKDPEAKDPEAVGFAFMNAMGFTSTGENKNVNGVPCSVFNSPGLGKVCYTDDWIMAEQSVMGQTTTITSLSREDLGDESMFDPEAWGVDIVEGPDLNAVLEGLNPGGLDDG